MVNVWDFLVSVNLGLIFSVSVCTLGGENDYLSPFSVLCCKKGTHRLLGHCLVFYHVCWCEMKFFLCGLNSQVMYLPVTINIHYYYVYCVGIWLESVKVIVNMLCLLRCHVMAVLLFMLPCFCSSLLQRICAVDRHLLITVLPWAFDNVLNAQWAFI